MKNQQFPSNFSSDHITKMIKNINLKNLTLTRYDNSSTKINQNQNSKSKLKWTDAQLKVHTKSTIFRPSTSHFPKNIKDINLKIRTLTNSKTVNSKIMVMKSQMNRKYPQLTTINRISKSTKDINLKFHI